MKYILSDKELSSLLKLAAAALENPVGLKEDIPNLIEDLDCAASELDKRRGIEI